MFLEELDARYDRDAVVQFECKGAFLTFKSRLVDVERPVAFSTDTVSRFGVVPHHVTLTFANGVRVNVYMKHVEEVSRRGTGVVISFRGEGGGKNVLSFYPAEQRKRPTG